MKFLSIRKTYFLGFLLSAGMLLASYYFQYVEGLQPCLLCLLQRFILVLLALVFLLAALHHPRVWTQAIYGPLLFFISLAGAAAAGRQVWLEHQPISENEACLPGINYLLHTKPLHEVLKIMMHGSRDCGEITWRFCQLSMPSWVLGFFVLMAVFAIWQMTRKE